jgi:Na+-translocating ferredoxin:NAD+ oxidoreductase subunit G
MIPQTPESASLIYFSATAFNMNSSITSGFRRPAKSVPTQRLTGLRTLDPRPFLFMLCCAIAGAVFAGVITRDEALQAAYPGAEIKSSMVFLTEAEVKQASQIAGSQIPSALIATFQAVKNGQVVGRAYLDTHVVRTKKESLIIMLDAEGKLKRVEVVAFLEPPEYMPPDVWYRQFDGKTLNDNLRIQKDIHPVTGATLTANATVSAVRRATAIDQILRTKQK